MDFISEYNARVKKPVITPRNKFFQLPELAERMCEKLKAMQSRENKEVPFEGGTLVWNYGEDRLQILFDRIPEDSRRKELKSSGFRWSPKTRHGNGSLPPMLSVPQKIVGPSKHLSHEKRQFEIHH